MIDKQYVESARNIKSEFISLNKKLEIYKKELVNLSGFLENTIKELDLLTKKQVSSKTELTNVGEQLIKKLEDVELEEKKLSSLIKPINDRIDKLREEENILYKALKQKYPNISDEELKKELHSYL
jgi:chromosome segregation ATPase